jgi:glyoxylase-like metal-dependent hydrolase (beta-lactamase superfamily II)
MVPAPARLAHFSPPMTRHELAPGITIHIHASGEGGIFVNAFLVETRNGVVAVDSTLTETESRMFRQELESLRKPLLAALVTHPHPDHVAGLTNLVNGEDTRIIATRAVVELMRTLEEPKRKQWTPVYGAEWVQRWTYPNVIVGSGERLTFDGLTYRVLDVGAGGDSDANAVWFIDSPQRTAFLGDLVFVGTHSYTADGHLLAWLANIQRLEELCRGMERVFPGHGPPDAPGGLIEGQRAYLLKLTAEVKDLAQGDSALSPEAKKELEARMTAHAPSAGLTFLISLGADAVARELNSPPTSTKEERAP